MRNGPRKILKDAVQVYSRRTRQKRPKLADNDKAYPHMSEDWLKFGPDAVYWLPRFLKEIWNVKAVYVTESGTSCDDRLTFDGEIHDTDRVMYLRHYMGAVHRAIDEGIPLKGYFAWSLFDNFEWGAVSQFKPMIPLPPYRDSTRSIPERVEDLLSRMTIMEKIGQLHMARAAESDSLAIRTLVREGMIGARILASSAYAGNEEQETATLREHNEVARIAREESRLGIPVLTGRDVLHGYRTVFPVPLAMAASWNPDAVEQAAAFTARETRSQGIHWTFAPNLDICRDPRWGRVFEGFGEDPYLAGKMAEASVKGLQGRTDEDLRSEARILACAKHFAGYGAPDGGRDYHTVELSEHTLRNIHLIPFLRAVEAGVGSFMSGFHDWNGESVSGSSHLLETILRKEWRATGFVVSDWASVEDLMRHRLAANRCESSALSFNAGVDMDMCSGCYLENLEAGSPEDIASAVQKADVVVLAIGESIKRNGENNSLAEIELPPGDHELIRLLATFEKPLIIVVCPGRPLVLTDAVRNADALLLAWNAGTEMARAIADILLERSIPAESCR